MCICLCFRAVLEGLWLRFKGEEVETDVAKEQRRRILQTLVWFCLTLILALFIPDIGRVISLIGGLAACFIFVFPGIKIKIFSDCTFLYLIIFFQTVTIFILLMFVYRVVFDSGKAFGA